MIKKVVNLLLERYLELTNDILQNMKVLFQQLVNKEIKDNDLESIILEIDALIGTVNDKTRTKVEGLKGKIISLLDQIVSYIESDKELVIQFIVDDLEKVFMDEQKVWNLFIELSQTIRYLDHCKIVLVIPQQIVYHHEFSTAQHNFQYKDDVFLPLFQVFEVYNRYEKRENQNEINLMKDIVRKRIPADVIPDPIVENSAKQSGGFVSILLKILEESCYEAKRKQQTFVDINANNIAIKKLIETYNQYIGSEYTPRLAEVHTNNEAEFINEQFAYLHERQAIFECMDSSNNLWVCVHPFYLRRAEEREDFKTPWMSHKK